MKLRTQKILGVVAILLLVGILIGGLSYKQVPEGHVGVTKEWGAVTGQTMDPGAHWKTPVAEGVQNVEVRDRTLNGTMDVTTLNGTTFTVNYVIRYKVDENRTAEFVEEWNTIEQAEDRLIEDAAEDRIRREGSDIQSSVIFQKPGRDRLSQAVTEILLEEFDGEALVLERVLIVDVSPPPSYQDALNDKEIAKQEVQKEQYNIQKERAKAEQRRVKARAEADVIETRGEALRNNPVVLEARKIEAYDRGTVFVTNGNQDMILDASGAQNTTSVPTVP